MANLDLLREEIRNSVPIAEVIGRYVRLERTGSNFKGLCPFHSEKTPSFFVSPTKKIFKCFGCGEGGDVISFLQKYENISFWEAVKRLADEYGIDLSQYVSQKGDDKSYSSVDKLKKANIVAMEFFSSMLFTPEGKEALEYLRSRNVDETTARIFRLGYAPDNDLLITYAQKRGVPPEALIEVGLARRSAEGNLIPFFRNRVIFPIFDRGNIPIGFAGRAINPSDEPKYLNITNTPIYDKSKAFYGINIALPEIIKLKQAIIVEGYMDVIAFYKANIKNSIATCGTALTEEHAKILRTIAPQVIMAYDSDEAGMKARYQSALILLKYDIIPYTIIFPEGEDPDSFINKFGKEKLQELVNRPSDFIEFWLSRKWQEDLPPNKQAEAIREVLRLVAVIQDALKVESYLKLISSKTGLEVKLLKRELRKIRRKELFIGNAIQYSNKTASTTTDYSQKRLLSFLRETAKFILKFGFHQVRLTEDSDEKYVRDIIFEALSPELIAYDALYEEIFNALKTLSEPLASPEDFPISEEAKQTLWHLIDSPKMLEQLFRVQVDSTSELIPDIKRITTNAHLMGLQLKQKLLEEQLKETSDQEIKKSIYQEFWEITRELRDMLKKTGASISLPID